MTTWACNSEFIFLGEKVCVLDHDKFVQELRHNNTIRRAVVEPRKFMAACVRLHDGNV